LTGLPNPQPEAHSREFWQNCNRQELRIQKCRACGTFRHTPQPVCARCSSTESDWERSAGRGTVFTYVIVHRSTHPATDESVPYNVAVIRLDDCQGILVTSNVVDCPAQSLRVGMPVELIWEEASPGLWLYRFRPAGNT
jgi:uncharacterized OB-fold protein